MSASSLWREEICAPSAWLPRTRARHADAVAGTEAHAVAAAEEPEGAEVGFALNYELGTARYAAPRGADGYPDLRPGEERGTADKVWRDAGLLTVDDRKTGFGYMVAAAGVNLQLAFYAVCAALVEGTDAVRVRLLDRDGAVTSEAMLDAIGLSNALERIRAIKRASMASERRYRETGDTPEVVAGAHCWRCEAVNGCPAHVTALVAMGRGEADAVWPAVRDMSDEELATAIAAAEVGARALKSFWASIYAVAATRPIRKANGKLWGPRPTETRTLDADVVRHVLRDMHGQPVADAASDYRTSQEALERALRPLWEQAKAAGQKVSLNGKTGLVTKAMAAIEAANGIRIKHGTEFTEYDPEASAPATPALPAKGEPNGAAQG